VVLRGLRPCRVPGLSPGSGGLRGARSLGTPGAPGGEGACATGSAPSPLHAFDPAVFLEPIIYY